MIACCREQQLPTTTYKDERVTTGTSHTIAQPAIDDDANPPHYPEIRLPRFSERYRLINKKLGLLLGCIPAQRMSAITASY